MYHKHQLALTDGNSMSLRSTTIFRLASKQSDSTGASSAQAQPVSTPSEPRELADAHRQLAATESQTRRQQLQPRFTSSSPVPELDEVAAEIDRAVEELRRRAYKNAPRCGGRNAHVQEWMTISQAADTFRMSKRVVSTWAKEGLVASIKGDAINSHRLVHIDGILAHMQQQLQVAKEASLRASQDADDSPGSDNDSNSAADEDDPMQACQDTREQSPIIVP